MDKEQENNKDFYKKINQIIKILNDKGYNKLSLNIEESIKYGTTGTEIFMKIKYCLKNLDKENIQLTNREKEIIDEILLEIDMVTQ